MKKKNCKLTGILRVIALPLVGSAGGFLYYRYVGCVLGSLLYTVLRPGRGKGQNGDGAE